VKPYYQHAGITIYHADCHEIVPSLPISDIDLVLTDPPYGMNYDTDGSRFTLGGRSFPPVIGDDKPFDPSFLLRFRNLVLWGFNHFPDFLKAGGAFVWIKRSDAALGKFLSDAEIAWNSSGCGVYAYRDTSFPISANRFHPTQKPVGLMAWCLGFYPTAQTILDPFMGSGTTLIAAKNAGKQVIGIEIEERYCEIAAKRLSQEVLAFGGTP
jgi:site-specific DNA-methyltransferase (adenine-specific)